MDDITSFGEWVKRRRQALGLTQDELARRVGCAKATIRKIESDERRPSVQIAERLADVVALAVHDRAAFLQSARAEIAADRLPQPAHLPSDLPSGIVTFLFSDIEGSTRLWHEHPRAMPIALARHDAIMRQVIASHRGVVFKTVGDAICAAFARPVDALIAALEAQRTLHRATWGTTGELKVRMALHTGMVEAHDGDYLGLPLSRVACTLSAGHGGQILLSAATWELVRDDLPQGAALRDLGEHRLKNLMRLEHIFQLVDDDLPADFPPLLTLDRYPTNIPAQATPLIGREHEVAAAYDLLLRSDVRLLTLTGPGGIGKTRLGLQVAAELADEFAHGVFFVALAPVTDPTTVAAAIARSLGVRGADRQDLMASLQAHLRDKQVLLLLDNFEQILAAVPLVANLLAAAPRLKVLITSRAVLHLYGEQEFVVPPLALPDPARLPAIELLPQFGGVALFTARAQAVKADFQLTPQNAQAVVQICHQLDGLPLAIELAAARSKLFAPATLLARLSSRLQLLTGGPRDLSPRHQTLRATIDWSYQLLQPDEQALFRRLAVFAGGCTLDAAEAVITLNVETFECFNVLDGLAALVDQSLLRQVEGSDGELRFLMLDTIREYALGRLAESGEEETIRHQHAAYYFALAREAEPQLRGAEQGRWLTRLAIEHDNLRSALTWRQAHTGAADAENLLVQEQIADVYYLLDERSQAIPIYQEALAHWQCRTDVPPLLEARLHRKILQTIWEMKYRSDFATWEALAQTHAALRSRLEALLQRLAGEAPQPEQVRLLVILSHDAAELTQPPDWTTAERYAQAAVSIAEQLDEPGELSAALDALDVVYLGRGLLRERVAVTLRRLALSSDRRLTDLRERGAILAKAGSALRDVGEYAQALVHLQEAEQLAQQLQATSMQVDALTAQSLCWLRLDRLDEVLKIDAERHDLEQRYSGEQMGATCAIGALAATAHAQRGARAAATAKREQAYDFMVGTAGPTERWTRGQHY